MEIEFSLFMPFFAGATTFAICAKTKIELFSPSNKQANKQNNKKKNSKLKQSIVIVKIEGIEICGMRNIDMQ